MHDKITARMLKVFPNFTPVPQIFFSLQVVEVVQVQCQLMEMLYDFGQFSLSCFSMILF